MNWLVTFFSDNQFLPHRFCLNNSLGLLTVSVISNALIFLAYFSIPVALAYFSFQRKEWRFKFTVLLFAGFILACGATHLLHIVTYWWPWYALQALFDFFTALISMYTAIYLWWLLPQWLNLPSHEQLVALNQQLQHEISERKQVEAALQQKNKELWHYFDQPLVGMLTANLDKKTRRVNQRFCDMVGYSQEEMQTLDWGKITHPDDIAINQRYVEQAIAGDIDNYQMEKRYIHKAGHLVYIHLAVNCIRNADGEAEYFIGMMLDITARKQAEQALQEKTHALERSNTDLEQFAYSVSHDMRQPLRAVTGHLQFMARDLRDTLDEDSQINLNFALEGAKRMDAMIVSLLEYSRVGRKTDTKTLLATYTILEEALAFLAILIEETQAQLKISGQWPTVFASRDELTRLFLNLLGNALKYTESTRPPVIDIESHQVADTWQVSIRDQGIGINPQQIPRLFQFFSRLQGRTRFEGTGMGLALCRRIVEHHGGHIGLESCGEGQGCCVRFTLPLNKKS